MVYYIRSVESLLTEIRSDDQLKSFLSGAGYLLNVDYPTRDMKLHRIECRYCNPSGSVGVKPSRKRLNNTGEFWYSDNRDELDSKAEEIGHKRGFNYFLCKICNP